MTFLGIGPGEFFLVLIILLVVVGPERLPGFARQAGKMIVGLRDWIQRSPDAQLFLRARDELEAELRAIRDDLTQEMETVRIEMQSVRDEMIQATREATTDAARQFDDAAQAARQAAEAAEQAARQATEAAEHAEQTVEQIEHVTEAPESLVPEARSVAEPPVSQPAAQDPIADTVDDTARTIAPPRPELPNNGQPLPVARTTKPNAPAAPAESTQAEIAALREQVQSLAGELRGLQEQIRVIQAERQPTQPAAQSEPAPQAEEVA